ncbi:MAG: alpha/beta hydrolase [Pseudomonadota bacterium]
MTHDETQTDGLVLLTPWDSLTSLASSIYWFMPVRWLIQDHYNSIANLRDYEGPIAVITAGQDRVIPNKHSERLFDKLETEKQRWHFSEAGHNSWPISPSGEWWREVMEFVSSE